MRAGEPRQSNECLRLTTFVLLSLARLSKLKHDIGRDRPLEPLRQDSGPDVKLYNSIIEREQPTWFNAAWLFAECYLYRLVRRSG